MNHKIMVVKLYNYEAHWGKARQFNKDNGKLLYVYRKTEAMLVNYND